MKTMLNVLFVSLFFATSVFAAPAAKRPAPRPSPTPVVTPVSTEVTAPAQTETPVVTSDVNEGNHDESWYWGFNLGGGGIKYSDAAIQASVDSLKTNSNVDHLSLYFDIFFLWPLENRKTALGFSIGGISDAYKNKISNAEMTLTASMLAFSAQHFFTSNIGEGR
jgi:hypothetical protein